MRSSHQWWIGARDRAHDTAGRAARHDARAGRRMNERAPLRPGRRAVHCAHPRWRRGPARTGRSSGSAARFPVTIAAHSAERLGEVQDGLNSGPRKCLTWETHAAVFARLQSDHPQAEAAMFGGIRPPPWPDPRSEERAMRRVISGLLGT